ncbi:MAG: helix-turn-helix transcriptional regulator [Brasilonema octagenarum HA4186-MV1]|jgi:DNA-binding HxlR family transcriptional regulator|nr:helix-turn-helix transcriptional regulator [Brasilonema octagenarum HA4186-MV1]
MTKQQAHSLEKNCAPPDKVGVKSQPTVAYIVEHTLGCKWMLEVLRLIRTGVNRPGTMTRSVDGLTTKVLNERLSDLLNFGIVEKIAYPEIPPRVEYMLTKFGQRFVKILDILDELEQFRIQQLNEYQ